MMGEELKSDRVWCRTRRPELFSPGGEEAWVFKYQLLNIIGYRLLLGLTFQSLQSVTSAQEVLPCSFGKGPVGSWQKTTNTIRSEENG